MEGNRAIVARTPDFLGLAGSVPVPAAKRNAAWDDVIRRTRAVRAGRGREQVGGSIDTNVLVRHLTGDPPAMARRATALLREASELYLTDLVVAETIYVLESYYELPREQIAITIQSLLALDSISVVDRDVLLRAVEVYEIDRLDFAEAYLVACAESTGVGRVVSFDRSIDRIPTVERVEP